MKRTMLIVVIITSLLPGIAHSLDGALPVTTLEEGWLRVDVDPPLVFRWSVDIPFAGIVEAEIADGRRSNMDTCVRPDRQDGSKRARLRIERTSPDEAVILDLGEPGTVNFLGVFGDRGSVVATFTASYSCAAVGASGPVETYIEWWTAVRLAPSLEVLEHRRISGNSAGCWNSYGSRLSVRPEFEIDAGRVWMVVSVNRWRCYQGASAPWTVRWPVGEAPFCFSAESPREKRSLGQAPERLIEIAELPLVGKTVGRVLADRFAYPISFYVALRGPEDSMETSAELPLFDVTGRLDDYARSRPILSSLVEMESGVDSRSVDGVYLATEGWPEATTACAAVFQSGAFDRFSDVEWKPLLSDGSSEIGLLSLPCEEWKDGTKGKNQRASWLVHTPAGPGSPVFVVSTCGDFSSFGRTIRQPEVAVKVQKDARRVRLEYDSDIEPRRFLATNIRQQPGGEEGGLQKQLKAAHTGVTAFVLHLSGTVEVETVRSRWDEITIGSGVWVSELVGWFGEFFFARTPSGGAWSSSGTKWRRKGGVQITPHPRREDRVDRSMVPPPWLDSCPPPEKLPREPRRMATNGKEVIFVDGRGQVLRATSCDGWRSSLIPNCYQSNDIAWTGRQYLVVGEEGTKGDSHGRIWSSIDGLRWNSEPIPLGFRPEHIAVSDDMIVVGGSGRLLVAPIIEPQ
ncbi:MAG: hypothetical protein GY906_06715 [bacterium]|nr:hypothetical protein [bacterium]